MHETDATTMVSGRVSRLVAAWRRSFSISSLTEASFSMKVSLATT